MVGTVTHPPTAMSRTRRSASRRNDRRQASASARGNRRSAFRPRRAVPDHAGQGQCRGDLRNHGQCRPGHVAQHHCAFRRSSSGEHLGARHHRHVMRDGAMSVDARAGTSRSTGRRRSSTASALFVSRGAIARSAAPGTNAEPRTRRTRRTFTAGCRTVGARCRVDRCRGPNRHVLTSVCTRQQPPVPGHIEWADAFLRADPRWRALILA